ncbi:MAG: lysozyme inhibitor LprI family protein [Rhodobacteraceae bacterium]|jgi:uncharacterized protein YecT (DUF1311 family)|nr:lysozyme inhibitor LprI family protein [Paracoccaceae bacterium]
MIRAAVALAVLAVPAAAQEIAFSPAATEACLTAAPADPATCIGHAADACMLDTDGGETTVGMGACLAAERDWWAARLATAEAAVAAAVAAEDTEMAGIGATVPPLAPALDAMRAAWAAWRDAACDWERVQWGGGTGQGPATAACLMRITGEQALSLESWLAERAAR